jgi:thiol:disulfide interchange protein DsbC
MTKYLKLVIAASVITATHLMAASSDVKLNAKQLEDVKSKSALFNTKNITFEKGVDQVSDGVYHIKAMAITPRGNQPIEAFIDKKNGNTYIGGGYDKSGKKLSFPVDKKTVEDGVAFTSGAGVKEIYVMTDPECPFCQRFEKEMGDKLEKGYKVNTVIYPLSFHHRAKPMLQWILRGKTDKDKADRFSAVTSGKADWAKELGFKHSNYDPRDQAAVNKYMEEYKPYLDVVSGKDKNWKKYFSSEKELKEFNDYLAKSEKAFLESQAKGTPNVFDKDFNEITPDKL